MPNFQTILVFLKPGIFTFNGPVVWSTLYLSLVAGVVAMSANYTTAWGVFATIQWGRSSSSFGGNLIGFVGHYWGN